MEDHTLHYFEDYLVYDQTGVGGSIILMVTGWIPKQNGMNAEDIFEEEDGNFSMTIIMEMPLVVIMVVIDVILPVLADVNVN